jgi:hypothetical protein
LLDREACSAEPAIYEWGLGGFRHDDTVVVGSALEVLTLSAAEPKSSSWTSLDKQT